MKNLRNRRLKTEAHTKYLNNAFDESLIQVELERNEKCMQQIYKNNFQKAQDQIKHIKQDLDLISSNKDKQVIKALSLNTEGYLLHKLKKYQQAMLCLNEAIFIQNKYHHQPAERARTLLNKCVIYSLLQKHEQAIEIAKEALILLREQKEEHEFQKIKKNQYKIYEIMIVSFYNIAVELSHLNQISQANKIYKEGFNFSQLILGSGHKLTQLLRSIVKKNKRNSLQKTVKQSVSSEKVAIKNKSFKNDLKFNDEDLNQKEKLLKKIYSKKKKSSMPTSIMHLKERQDKSYEKYLGKVKNLYSRSSVTQNQQERKHDDSPELIENVKGLGINRTKRKFKQSKKKIHTENRYDASQHQQNIKDIIMNGKDVGLKKESYLLKKDPESLPAIENKKAQQNTLNIQKQTTISRLEPIIHSRANQVESAVVNDAAQKFKEEHEKTASQCQLI